MVDVRDDKGKFVKGQSGNPAGRPKREVEKAYLDATIGKVSLEDWGKIVEKAVSQAKEGDGEARKWLSEYLLGKPTQQIDITGSPTGVIEVQWAFLPAVLPSDPVPSIGAHGNTPHTP